MVNWGRESVNRPALIWACRNRRAIDNDRTDDDRRDRRCDGIWVGRHVATGGTAQRQTCRQTRRRVRPDRRGQRLGGANQRRSDPRDGSSRFTRALRAAAREAIADAAQRCWVPGARVGLLHAVVISEVEGWRDFYLKDAARRRVRDYLTLMPSAPISMLMREYDFHGPAMNVSAMCSSGNAGLITANMWLEWIRRWCSCQPLEQNAWANFRVEVVGNGDIPPPRGRHIVMRQAHSTA
jgi:hypothetical protein